MGGVGKTRVADGGFDAPVKREKSRDRFMASAILEAKKSIRERGIPIGAVLVKNGEIIGRGSNQRVQTGNRMAHAEMVCLEDALRKNEREEVIGATIYTTLMPCHMCAGAIIHYGILKVVAAENKTFPNAQYLLEREDIKVTNLALVKCQLALGNYVKSHPEYWKSGNFSLEGKGAK